MIRIRYRGSNEFSPGLHAAAERRGRKTTVYLLSGLTVPERRSALRRLRLSARMGHCPRLPAGQLGFALLADRVRTGIGRAGAVLRLHPAGSTVPIMVISGGAIAFLLFSTVSIRVLHDPQASAQSATGTSPAVSAGAIPVTGGSQGPGAGLGGPGGAGSPGDPGGLGRGSDTRQLTQPVPGGGSAPGTSPGLTGAGGGAGAGSGGTGGSGGTTLSGGANPTLAPTPAASTPAGGATAPAVAPSPAAPRPASSSSSGSPGGVCVNVGPLGVCLNI